MNGLSREPSEQRCSSCGEVKATREFYAVASNAVSANAQALASDESPIRRRLANVLATTPVSTAPLIQRRLASAGANGAPRI